MNITDSDTPRNKSFIYKLKGLIVLILKEIRQILVPSRKKLFIVSALIVFFLVIIYLIKSYYQYRPDEERPNPPGIAMPGVVNTTPTLIPDSDPTMEYPNIPFNGRMAYLKDSSLYLFDHNGSRKISQQGEIYYYKWSDDGRYLGWIERQKTSIKDSLDIRSTYTLKVLDFNTNLVKDWLVEKSDDFRISFASFAFSSNNEEIYYVFNGVNKFNRISGIKEKLLGDVNVPNDELRSLHYNDITKNPQNNLVLLKRFGWEWWNYSFYDMDKKQPLGEIKSPPQDSAVYWSCDGNKVMMAKSMGRSGNPGLWIASVNNLQPRLVIGNPDSSKLPTTDVYAYDCFGNKGLASLIIDTPENRLNRFLGIYILDENYQYRLIKKFAENGIAGYRPVVFLPGGSQIAFWSDSGTGEKLDLKLINFDGAGEVTLIHDKIDSLKWSPI